MKARSPLGFRARLTLRWTVTFSLLLAAVSVWIYIAIQTTFYAYLDKQLRTLAATEVTSAVDTPTSSPHLHDLPRLGLAAGTFAKKIAQVFDERGALVAATPDAVRLPLVGPDDVAAGLAGEAPFRTVTVGSVPYRVVVLRANADGREYALAVGVGMADLLASLTEVKWLLVMVWAASTAATSALGFALASTALRPVRRMTERALSIARSDIRARLEPSVINDEIGVMTQALNTLIERLHVALDANRQFAADAAHELRSPVTAIAGEVEVALRRERSAGEYRQTLQVVQDRLNSLTTLISDLMLLVRAQESAGLVRAKEVSIDRVVAAAAERLRSLAVTKQVTISIEAEHGLVTYADAGLLGRVFDNVLENAIRYNRDGGSVIVNTAFTESSTEDDWAAGVITVRVRDTGAGIPDDERERVFERFYRVDQSRARFTGGTGLGLAIAREVLALFNGSIHVEASTPSGTVIAVTIPGNRVTAAGAPPPSGGAAS